MSTLKYFFFDNLVNSFTFNDMYDGQCMYDTEENKNHIHIIDNLLNYQQPH